MKSNMPLRSELVCMFTIIDRNRLDKIIETHFKEEVKFNVSALARGAARNDLLDYLGLNASPKYIVISLMSSATALKIHDSLEKDFLIGKAGNGISFVTPIGKIGGIRLSALYKENERGIIMDKEFLYEVIFAISARGFSDDVMNAARDIAEVGGTLINARGVGFKEAEKFLGISITPEKEIIMILTKKEDTRDIMSAIIEKAGPATKAKTIAFSLPVYDVVGLPDDLYYEQLLEPIVYEEREISEEPIINEEPAINNNNIDI